LTAYKDFITYPLSENHVFTEYETLVKSRCPPIFNCSSLF